MIWKAVRELYKEKWILIEAIKANSVNGKRVVDDMSVVGVYDKGNEALKDYSNRHKEDKNREYYVCNTINEELITEERTWIGVRKNG
ncbi:MAG: hypothetical protein ACRC68_08880 [Clostridium sp.]